MTLVHAERDLHHAKTFLGFGFWQKLRNSLEFAGPCAKMSRRLHHGGQGVDGSLQPLANLSGKVGQLTVGNGLIHGFQGIDG
jgi:hypothetical protein